VEYNKTTFSLYKSIIYLYDDLFIFLFCMVSVSSKMILHRPIAGSQVPFCPMEKKMLDCWSHIEPCSFKVRGQSYFR